MHEDDDCPHTHTTTQRSNSGDGSSRFDFYTEVCVACGEEVGETDTSE